VVRAVEDYNGMKTRAEATPWGTAVSVLYMRAAGALAAAIVSNRTSQAAAVLGVAEAARLMRTRSLRRVCATPPNLRDA
jgi:hypothetical protein